MGISSGLTFGRHGSGPNPLSLTPSGAGTQPSNERSRIRMSS